MAGIALGSIIITANIARIRNSLALLIRLEIILIIFSFILAGIITQLSSFIYSWPLIFIVLFFVAGMLMGSEFPLASKIYLDNRTDIGQVTGLLYASDLIGGWLAGILGGIIFLPILGIFNTCIVIVILKLSSIFLLMYAWGHS